MRDRNGAARALGLMLIAMIGASAWGQEPKPPVKAWVLERIVVGPIKLPLHPDIKPPEPMIADVDGGEIRFQMKYNDECTETYSYTWKFDRDIYAFAPGDKFKVTLSAQSGGDCNVRSAFAVFAGGNGRLLPRLPEGIVPKSVLDDIRGNNTMGTTDRVYAERSAVSGNNAPTQATAEMSVWGPSKGEQYYERIYFAADFYSAGFQPGQRFDWHVLYIYKAVRGENPIPPRSDVQTNAPRPDRDPDTIGSTPGGTTPGETPGGTTPGGTTPGGTTPGGTTPGGTTPGGTTPGGTTPGGTTPGGTTPGGTTPGGVPGAGDRGPDGIPVAPQPGRAIIADKRLVEPGGTVYLPVFLRDPGDVASLNVDLSYNTSVVAVAGKPTQGPIVGGQLFQANENQAGRVRVGVAGDTGVTRTGILVYIPFRAVGRPGDVTPVTPNVTTITDSSGATLPIAEIAGEVRISAPGGGVPGDCDGDGVLTAADALCALKMSVGLLTPRTALDADQSGDVTANDARIILQRAP